MSSNGVDDMTLSLIKTPIGMEYTVQKNEPNYFSGPPQYLGDQLNSYGQLLVIQVNTTQF